MLKSFKRIEPLSDRESEVARAYARGLSYREIAETLGISPSTVRTHLNSIFRKLEVSNKLELLRIVEATDQSQPTRPTTTYRLPWVLPGALAFLALCAVVLGYWLFSQSDAGEQQADALFDGPSIAVMPFEVTGGDADGPDVLGAINRDIITDLSQFRGLFVIAADSSFRPDAAEKTARVFGEELGVRYVLNGAGSWQGDRLEVTLRLIESATGRVVWSERFDTTRNALLTFQTDVVTRVVGVIGPLDIGTGKLRQIELDRIQRRATDSPEAYDLFLEGMTAYEQFTRESNIEARGLFKSAFERDPDYAKAYAMAAWTYVLDIWMDRTEDRPGTLASADELLRNAAEADPFEPYVSWARGGYHLFNGEHQQSLAAYRKALDLNPNGADHMMFLGWSMVYAGQAEDALAVMEEGFLRNPYHPGWYHYDQGFAYLFARQYDKAIETLEEREPKTMGTYELLAASYARAGDLSAATAAMSELIKRSPDFSLERVARVEPYASPEDLDWYIEGLRLAGAPERAP